MVAKPVFLDVRSGRRHRRHLRCGITTAGTALATIPQPIGTLTNTIATPPAQQNAAGIGGEVQLAFPHLALAGGYTPFGFLVSTFIARAIWRPGNGRSASASRAIR